MPPSNAWAFEPHVGAWAALGALLGAHLLATRGIPDVRRMRTRFGSGLVAGAAAMTWPLADLGRRYSFTAQLGAHLLLVLAAAPLLLLGLPTPLVTRMTSTRWSDTVARWCGIPAVAATIGIAVVVTAHLPPVVAAGVDHAWVGPLVDAFVLLGGLILWVPVLGLVPGARRLGSGGRIGYLVVVSIVPNVPGSFLTFSGHPVFASLIPGNRVLGLSSTLDCQLAGVLAKLGAATVLWVVAAVIFFRSFEAEQAGPVPAPLEWAEVEREFQRVDWRARRRA